MTPDQEVTAAQVDAEYRQDPHDMGHQPAYRMTPEEWANPVGLVQQPGEGDPVGYPVEEPWWVHKALNEAERLASPPGAAVPGVLGHDVRRWALVAQSPYYRVYFTACESCKAMGTVVVPNPHTGVEVHADDRANPQFLGTLFSTRCQWEGT